MVPPPIQRWRWRSSGRDLEQGWWRSHSCSHTWLQWRRQWDQLELVWGMKGHWHYAYPWWPERRAAGHLYRRSKCSRITNCIIDLDSSSQAVPEIVDDLWLYSDLVSDTTSNCEVGLWVSGEDSCSSVYVCRISNSLASIEVIDGLWNDKVVRSDEKVGQMAIVADDLWS